MIRLQPYIDLEIECPGCGNRVQPVDWLISGMHSMGEIQCPSCQKHAYLELPVNSGLFYPGMIDAESGKRCDKLPIDNWYLTGLVDAFKNRSSDQVKLEIISHRELGNKPVLILNTLDATYGHALYELFNADYYLSQKEYDLVILVQRAMLWLVPEGAAQVWVADLSFSRAVKWFDQLALEIKARLRPFTDVFICRSFVQADSTDFNISSYTRCEPFPLHEWNERLKTPTVTFIWRTDRFWRRVLPRVIDNRVTHKLFPSIIERLRNRIQFNWILKFSAALRQAAPTVDFAIAGMDERVPPLPEWIRDYRYPAHEDETARLQVKRYAESHVVLGCNGSSLLLPGCLAGGVIDIVPGDQWAVSAGTFPFRFTSIGDTHYRYVMVPCEVTISRLVNILVAMIRDRAYIELQTSPPWRDHKASLDPFAWSAYRQEAFAICENFTSDSGLITKSKKNSE